MSDARQSRGTALRREYNLVIYMTVVAAVAPQTKPRALRPLKSSISAAAILFGLRYPRLRSFGKNNNVFEFNEHLPI